MSLTRSLIISTSLLINACGGGSGGSTASSNDFFAGEEKSAGTATTFRMDGDAFSERSANMSVANSFDFDRGNRFFTDPWQVAPSPSASGRDGLGPLFNVASCQACHIKDGRGHAPVDSNDSVASLLIRLSLPRSALSSAQQDLLDDGLASNIGDPIYGGQLQDTGILGNLPSQREGSVSVNYQTQTETFADGFQINLRKPTFTITNLNYGALHPSLILSPRVAQPMIGLGMLEAIPESVLLDAEDINDDDNNGISGKINRVFDVLSATPNAVGRFGWKAGQPTVLQQSAGAFNGDIGITSSLFPNQNCTATQLGLGECDNAVSGGTPDPTDPEVSETIMTAVGFYSRNLAVPARRMVDAQQVLEGRALFYDSGCTNCHTPKYQLPNLPAAQAEQSGQLIWPYTDLLLHDMGDALADTNAITEPIEFLATGAEWRTPPLWGIGLTKIVSIDATFLHDGRARNLLEAVLWHGGEAEAAKQAVLIFNIEQRAALVAFLESL